MVQTTVTEEDEVRISLEKEEEEERRDIMEGLGQLGHTPAVLLSASGDEGVRAEVGLAN
jgi:hypothetical protein